MPNASITINRRYSVAPMSIPDMVRETYALSSHSSSFKLSKRQLEVKLVPVIDNVMSEEASVQWGEFMRRNSGLLFLGALLKGLSMIYVRLLESFLKDCEHPGGVSSPARIPTAIRRFTSGRRGSGRRSLVSVLDSVGGRDSLGLSPIMPFETTTVGSIMDLDALCEELSRRPSMCSGVAPLAKRVRSSSSDDPDGGRSVSRDTPVDLDVFPAFEDQILPLLDENILNANLPHSPPIVRAKAQLRGFDPKPTFTNLQWSSLTRRSRVECIERKMFDISKIWNSYKSAGAPTRVNHISRAEVSSVLSHTVGLSHTDEGMSVEGLDDELRADPFIDHYEEIIPPRRESFASSFAPSRRVSDVSRRGSGEFSDFKKLIQEEIGNESVLKLSQVDGTRNFVASAFSNLLVLAAQGEIKFTHKDLCFQNSSTFYVVASDE